MSLPSNSRIAGKTDAMAAEVSDMEQRLAALKANLNRDREKRDQSRQKNPSGSMWCVNISFQASTRSCSFFLTLVANVCCSRRRSARNDVPTNASYVEGVLRQPASACQPAPPSGAPTSLQPRRRSTPPTSSAAGGNAPSRLLEPGALVADAGKPGGIWSSAQQGAGGGQPACKAFDGTGGGLGGGTRSMFEWNLSASQGFLNNDDNE